MLTEQEYCVGVDTETEGFWYENDGSQEPPLILASDDLQLAAELGKTLLERNKDLENQMRQSQQVQYDQAREIDLLAKQLDALRNVSDSRMRIYEEVDRNVQEQEKENQQYKKESKADKEQIKDLQEVVKTLETRTDELEDTLKELRTHERQREKREAKRTLSVPSLVEASDYYAVFGYDTGHGLPTYQEIVSGKCQFDDKVFKLKEEKRKLKAQLDIERRKCEDLELDVVSLAKENHGLENRIEEIERSHAKEKSLRSELQDMELTSSCGKLCRACGRKVSLGGSDFDSELIENDYVTHIQHGEIVRLKNGGSAFGSRESLNMLGLETDDIQVGVETCEDILVQDSREHNPDISLLGELEEQYRALVWKYETMIDMKSKKNQEAKKEAATQDDLNNVPSGASQTAVRPEQLALGSGSSMQDEHTFCKRTGICLDLTSPVDPTEGHFQNGPPEYKRLFKEIFLTLRRSVVYEDDTQVGGDDNDDDPTTAAKSP